MKTADAAFKNSKALTPYERAYYPFTSLDYIDFLNTQRRYADAEPIATALVKRQDKRMPADPPILKCAQATLVHANEMRRQSEQGRCGSSSNRTGSPSDSSWSSQNRKTRDGRALGEHVRCACETCPFSNENH